MRAGPLHAFGFGGDIAAELIIDFEGDGGSGFGGGDNQEAVDRIGAGDEAEGGIVFLAVVDVGAIEGGESPEFFSGGEIMSGGAIGAVDDQEGPIAIAIDEG